MLQHCCSVYIYIYIYVTVGQCRDIAALTRPFYLLPLVCVEILTVASFRSLFRHPSPFHKRGPCVVRYCQVAVYVLTYITTSSVSLTIFTDVCYPLVNVLDD